MGRLTTFVFYGTLSLVFVVASMLGLIGMLLSGEIEGSVLVVVFCLFSVGAVMLINFTSEIILITSKELTKQQKHALNNLHPVTPLEFPTYFNIIRKLLSDQKVSTYLLRYRFLYWLSQYFILSFIAVCIFFLVAGFTMYLYK